MTSRSADDFVTGVNVIREGKKKRKSPSSVKAIVQFIDDNVLIGRAWSQALSAACVKEEVEPVTENTPTEAFWVCNMHYL